MIYIGIDPGYKGAIAAIGKNPGEYHVYDMPVRKEGKRTFYEAQEICNLLEHYTDMYEKGAIGLEYVRRWVKLSEGIGLLRGVIEVCAAAEKGWSLVEIHPKRWQAYHKIKKADKELSLEIARKKFPSLADKLKRSKDHNRAEALLIADYLRGRKR